MLSLRISPGARREVTSRADSSPPMSLIPPESRMYCASDLTGRPTAPETDFGLLKSTGLIRFISTDSACARSRYGSGPPTWRV